MNMIWHYDICMQNVTPQNLGVIVKGIDDYLCNDGMLKIGRTGTSLVE